MQSNQVDSFFMLCVACKFGSHKALVYMDGIWSTRRSGMFNKSDLMLAQMTDGF